MWSPDGIWQIDTDTRHEGRDAIAQAVQYQWRTFPHYAHWTTNHSIWIDGDAAHGECDALTYVRLHSGRWARIGGTYRDEYRRVDGEWRISLRDASLRFSIDPGPQPDELFARGTEA